MSHAIFSDAAQAALRAKHPPFRGVKPGPAAKRTPPARRPEKALPMPASVRGVALEVCSARGVTLDQLTGLRGVVRLCAARDEAMWRASEIRNASGGRLHSLAQIGRYFGGRDHTTARAAILRHERRMVG